MEKQNPSLKRSAVSGRVVRDRVIVSRDASQKDAADLLWSKNGFGVLETSALSLSLVEALFLIEAGKMVIFHAKKELSYDDFLRKALRIDKKFLQRYLVFRDLRSRGYSLRAGLKYGADFLVYERGKKPGKHHSKWLLFVFSESDKFSWRSWTGSNRVAHSVRKRALIGIVDDNKDVTYYEVSWLRP